MRLRRARAERILGILHRLGFTLSAPELTGAGPAGRSHVLQGLDEFREHMGGRLTIPMIRAPGERIDLHAIDSALVEESLAELKSRYG